MFLFVIPGEFCTVPPSSLSPAITCLRVPRCVSVCARERDGWSAGVYTGVFIPFQARSSLHPPPCPICFPSPPSPTVNQMAGQFGNSIKALVFMTMIMVMMMTSIYFNYLMKPLAKANRCRAGTISCSLKDPCNVTAPSEISPAKQKNGPFQRPLVTRRTEQYLIIGWERSATTSSLWRKE